MADDQIYCPSCDQKLSLPPEYYGRAVECPYCHARFTAPVPRGEVAPPVLPAGDAAAPVLESGRPHPDEPAAGAVRARRSLLVPAGALVLLSMLITVVSMYGATHAEQVVRDLRLQAQDPDLPPQLSDLLQRYANAATPENVLWSNLLTFVWGGTILVCATQMLRLRHYGFAVLGAFLALLPLNGPCCVVEAPFGLWALLVLMRPDVRRAFE